MKTKSIVSLFCGVALLSMSLLGSVASAATGSVNLSGATAQTNGTFTASINLSSDTTFNYAEVYLSFSPAVQNVKFTYDGSFVGQSCGAHCAGGYLPGGTPAITSGKLATVQFTLASPGSVSVGIDSASYFGHPNPPQAATPIAATGSQKTFTYNAPATNPSNGDSAPAPTTKNTTTNNANNKTATNNSTANTDGEVAGDETKAAETAKTDDKKKDDSKKSDDKKDDEKKTSSSAWFWPVALVAVIAGYVAARTMRSRAAAKAAADAEAAAAAKTASDKPKNKKNKN